MLEVVYFVVKLLGRPYETAESSHFTWKQEEFLLDLWKCSMVQSYISVSVSPVRRWVTSLLGPLVIVYIMRRKSHL